MSGREDEVLQRQYWQELETEGTEFSPLEVTQNPHMSMVSCLSQLSATVTSPCNKKGGSFWLSFRGLDALLLASMHLARQQVLGVPCDRPSCLPCGQHGRATGGWTPGIHPCYLSDPRLLARPHLVKAPPFLAALWMGAKLLTRMPWGNISDT